MPDLMEEYVYMSTLGEGTYGHVWQCEDRATGSIVAIKAFKAAHTEPQIKRLAYREIRMLQGLDHPAVVPLLDAFRSKSGRVYMVFPCLSHSALEALDDHPDGLPPQQLKLLTWQLLQALSYLHGRKVIHRDIKPANVLISDEGQARLCDFGFARGISCGVRGAEPMSPYVVTRWYRPPEVLVGCEYGPAADIWSLGCTVAELASGMPLFQGTSTFDQLWRITRCFGTLPPALASRVAADPRLHHLSRMPLGGRSLRQRLPRCEPGLMRLLEACLQLDPARRGTAHELLQSPYFWSVPRLMAGTHLETVYGNSTAGKASPAAAEAEAAAAPPDPKMRRPPSRRQEAAPAQPCPQALLSAPGVAAIAPMPLALTVGCGAEGETPAELFDCTTAAAALAAAAGAICGGHGGSAGSTVLGLRPEGRRGCPAAVAPVAPAQASDASSALSPQSSHGGSVTTLLSAGSQALSVAAPSAALESGTCNKLPAFGDASGNVALTEGGVPCTPQPQPPHAFGNTRAEQPASRVAVHHPQEQQQQQQQQRQQPAPFQEVTHYLGRAKSDVRHANTISIAASQMVPPPVAAKSNPVEDANGEASQAVGSAGRAATPVDRGLPAAGADAHAAPRAPGQPNRPGPKPWLRVDTAGGMAANNDAPIHGRVLTPVAVAAATGDAHTHSAAASPAGLAHCDTAAFDLHRPGDDSAALAHFRTGPPAPLPGAIDTAAGFLLPRSVRNPSNGALSFPQSLLLSTDDSTTHLAIVAADDEADTASPRSEVMTPRRSGGLSGRGATIGGFAQPLLLLLGKRRHTTTSRRAATVAAMGEAPPAAGATAFAFLSGGNSLQGAIDGPGAGPVSAGGGYEAPDDEQKCYLQLQPNRVVSGAARQAGDYSLKHSHSAAMELPPRPLTAGVSAVRQRAPQQQEQRQRPQLVTVRDGPHGLALRGDTSRAHASSWLDPAARTDSRADSGVDKKVVAGGSAACTASGHGVPAWVAAGFSSLPLRSGQDDDAGGAVGDVSEGTAARGSRGHVRLGASISQAGSSRNLLASAGGSSGGGGSVGGGGGSGKALSGHVSLNRSRSRSRFFSGASVSGPCETGSPALFVVRSDRTAGLAGATSNAGAGGCAGHQQQQQQQQRQHYQHRQDRVSEVVAAGAPHASAHAFLHTWQMSSGNSANLAVAVVDNVGDRCKSIDASSTAALQAGACAHAAAMNINGRSSGLARSSAQPGARSRAEASDKKNAGKKGAFGELLRALKNAVHHSR